MDKYRFGNYLYQKRKALNLTQDELGKKLGCTNKAVSKWETGETLPEITMLEQIAQVLNVTVDELLTQKDNETINKRNVKINKFLLFITILLFIVEVATIIITLIPKRVETKTLNVDNYSDYIEITPLSKFEVVDESLQELNITSQVKLINKYEVSEQIIVNLKYSISYYFYYNDGSIGLVSYFNRIKEVVINDVNEVFFMTELAPKTEITNIKSIKSIEINYEVMSCEGRIVPMKGEKINENN